MVLSHLILLYIGVNIHNVYHTISKLIYTKDMSILRGCMGYGGPSVCIYSVSILYMLIRTFFQLLQYKDDILKLVSLLVDKTLSERGYTSTGRLIARILNTVTGVHPINSRFVNSDEWDDPGVFILLYCAVSLTYLGVFALS